MIVVFLLVFSFKTVNSKTERPRISRNNRKSFFTNEAVKPREPFFHGQKKSNRPNLDSRRTNKKETIKGSAHLWTLPTLGRFAQPTPTPTIRLLLNVTKQIQLFDQPCILKLWSMFRF